MRRLLATVAGTERSRRRRKPGSRRQRQCPQLTEVMLRSGASCCHFLKTRNARSRLRRTAHLRSCWKPSCREKAAAAPVYHKVKRTALSMTSQVRSQLGHRSLRATLMRAPRKGMKLPYVRQRRQSCGLARGMPKSQVCKVRQGASPVLPLSFQSGLKMGGKKQSCAPLTAVLAPL